MYSTILLVASAISALPALVFICYPVILRSLQRAGSLAPATATCNVSHPVSSIGIIVTAVAVDDMLWRKLDNLHRLHSATVRLTIYICIDGEVVETDVLNRMLHNSQHKEPADPSNPGGAIPPSVPVRWLASKDQIGKNAMLNLAIEQAREDVLLFSDVDALLPVDTITKLLSCFNSTDVGAVVGGRSIIDENNFSDGQRYFVKKDEHLRQLEMSVLGCSTSGDGKLQAIRSEFLQPLPLTVTDDLFNALGAPLNGKRLVFDSRIRAVIGRPARNAQHELSRRRRITNCSLHSLWHRRTLLNPFSHGRYSLALIANKLCRRLLPLSVFTSVLFALWSISLLWMVLFVFLFAVVTGAVFHTEYAITPANSWQRKFQKVAYLILGSIAMTMGVLDFIAGKKVSAWKPLKS